MRIGRDHLVTRLLGVGMGLGFLALGVFALAGGGLDPGDRAIGLGIALVVVGTAAVVGSLTVADPTRIW
jgi:hypothetical protein